MSQQPLCIDLFCGLGGWTEGFLAEGYRVVGFDIEQHVYGEERYPGQLVLQDVRTIHGKQFKDATVIVASSPCQAYSYMAMPWTRAKQIADALRGRGQFPEGYRGYRTTDELNDLFEQPKRIQREACEAANPAAGRCHAFVTCERPATTIGHWGRPVCAVCSEWGWREYGPPNRTPGYRFIPMIQENVKGAQPWVGPAIYNYGSFYLWGDVPALMPITSRALKGGAANWRDHGKPGYKGEQLQDRFAAHTEEGLKNDGGSWFNIGSPGPKQTNQNPVRHLSAGWREKHYGETVKASYQVSDDGVKGFTPNGQPLGKNELGRRHGSKSKARKAASAKIAKIPFPLASHIARVYKPREAGTAA